MLDVETLILQYLIQDSVYFSEVINYIKSEFFRDIETRKIVDIIKKYYNEQNKQISLDVLGIQISHIDGINQETFNKINNLFLQISQKITTPDTIGMIAETEKYFKRRYIWRVLEDGIIEISDVKNKGLISSNLLEKTEKALLYSFNKDPFYKYKEKFSDRISLYQENVLKISTSSKMLNSMTDGGIEKQTLNACISSTNGGKTVWLCQETAYNLLQGKNVLYITLEMSRNQISKRIDANLMNIKQDDLKTLSPESAIMRFKHNVMDKTLGDIYIVELPADSSTTLDIKKQLDKIQQQDKVHIDMVVVDYIGILGSYNYSSKTHSLYTIGSKKVEELRNLAVQYDIPIWTAIQFNRSAENADELKSIGLGQTSDSYGMPMGLDFVFAILHTDELDIQKKAVFKILKSRYGERKKATGVFTVIQNYANARFEDDPDVIIVENKTDNKTKAIRDINKKLEGQIDSKENSDIIRNKNEDIFGESI